MGCHLPSPYCNSKYGECLSYVGREGKTPMDKYFELSQQTPYQDEVLKDYIPEAEHIQDPNYKIDLEVKRLKRCP